MADRPTTPRHYFMATALVTYLRQDADGDAKARQRHVNVIMEGQRRTISQSIINDARHAVLFRIMQEQELQQGDVRDLVFLGFTYLGLMKPEDFYDIPQDAATTARPN